MDNKTAIQKALSILDDALRIEYMHSVGVEFDGTHIVLPEGTTLKEGYERLGKMIKQEDEEVVMVIRIPRGHVNDGLHAVNTILTEKFQRLMTKATETWFGTIPGTTIAIETGLNKTEQVPVGSVEIPGIPITMNIGVSHGENPMDSEVYIEVKYKRRYEPFVKDMERSIMEYVRTHSIFLNSAIDSRFNFIDIGGDMSKMIYGQRTGAILKANLFSPLENRRAILDSGISLKRTILMYGAYGAGKTATGKLAAQTAIANGYTVMLVRPGDNFSVAFKFAMKYQPCLLIFEDVDTISSGERNIDLNNVLDVMDGILTKDAQVITVFTTNHRNRINKAMRRAGRIDVMLELGVVERDSIVALVSAYAGDNLEGELDEEALYKASIGYSPVYIAEGVRRATLYKIAENRSHITCDDIVNGLMELRSQHDWMNQDQENLPEQTIDSRLSKIVRYAIRSSVNECAIKDDV